MFSNTNRSLWEWLIILPLKNGKYIIKSYKDGMTMTLYSNDICKFTEELNHTSQMWNIEYKDGYYFFVSEGNGNVIQANQIGMCLAACKNRQGWERMIVSPVTIGGNYVNIPPRH